MPVQSWDAVGGCLELAASRALQGKRSGAAGECVEEIDQVLENVSG